MYQGKIREEKQESLYPQSPQTLSHVVEVGFAVGAEAEEIGITREVMST